jgi:hypothetical protein
MITGAAYCAHNLIARTTKLVIILMVGRRIALIGLWLAGRRGFRRYDQGKMEAWGISLQPGPRCPNARKSEIVVYS